jgi:betaine lipid synthase
MSSFSSTPVGSFLSRMEPIHAYIAGAGFLVCALVGVVLTLSNQRNKFDYNRGIFTYLRFIYASFLKPHKKGLTGQQDALESFYKTQV